MKNLSSKQQEVNPTLVTVHLGQPTTTSLKIAETFGKKHKNVLQAIERLECSDQFARLNFQPSEYQDTTGRTLPMCIVTEKGFSMLAMGFNGKRAAEWREKYIDAFDAMKTALLQRQSLEWQEARAAGKIARRAETDAIRELVDYARENGSQHPEKYYVNTTRMVYRALGFQDTHRPIRDLLSPQQQAALTIIESAVTATICSGIQAGTLYRDIYATAKARAYELASVLVPNVPRLAA